MFKGGFRLTKSISNNINVLSIPEENRTKGIKNQDITGELPVEKALQIHWVIEENMLGFNVSLKDKSLTTRLVLYTLNSNYNHLGLVGQFLPGGRIM